MTHSNVVPIRNTRARVHRVLPPLKWGCVIFSIEGESHHVLIMDNGMLQTCMDHGRVCDSGPVVLDWITEHLHCGRVVFDEYGPDVP